MRSAAAPPALPNLATGLTFKFGSAAPTAPKSPTAPAQPAKLPTQFFSRAPVASAGTNTESMRLNAVIDDLTQRLRKTTDAKTQCERQLTQASAMLTKERSNYSSRLNALQSEVETVQGSEMRLRSELAARPAVKEIKTSEFATRCRAALELEETTARANDASARVAALVKKEETLASQIKLLEARKESVITKNDVQQLVDEAASAQQKIDALTEHHIALEDDVLRFTALREAHKDDAMKAGERLEAANNAIATAVADEVAAKAQLQSMLLEHGDVCQKVAFMHEKLTTLSAAAESPRAFTVSGAEAPERDVQGAHVFGSQLAKVSACASAYAVGVPSHFSFDVPVNITAAAVANPSENPQLNDMVNALIGDLQDLFKSSATLHDKIGASVVPAEAASAIEVM